MTSKGGPTYEGEEVAALVIGSAVEVGSGLHAVVGHVGGRVSDEDGAVEARTDVLPHVARDSLDVGGRQGRLLLVVDDLVAREEGHGVGVLAELVDRGEDALEVVLVVRRGRLRAVDRVERVVGVQNDVDALGGQRVHARAVVLGVVGRVDADRVDAERLELLDIRHAHLLVGERVNVARRATGLVVEAADVEALSALEEGVALDRDGREGRLALGRAGLHGGRGHKRGQDRDGTHDDVVFEAGGRRRRDGAKKGD